MRVDAMHTYLKIVFCSLCFILHINAGAQQAAFQTDILKPDPAKEVKFLPYLAVRNGGMPTIESWKKNNTYKYYQELWYFSESFYIKRNALKEGIELDESLIDISRFEINRKNDEESTVVLQGFRDVIVLLPESKLIYKPDYLK